MRYATFRGEKTVAELVNRLYQLPQMNQLSRATVQPPMDVQVLIARAESALKAANPALKTLDKIPPGLVLLVPPINGLNVTPASFSTGTTALEPLAEIRQAVQDDQQLLNSSAQSRQTELLEMIDGLDNDPDWKPLQQIINFDQRREAARAEGKQQFEQLNILQAQVKLFAKQIDIDLKKLSDVFE